MRIAILAMPGVQMLDVAGPMDVFSEANKLINGRSGYELSVVGCNSEPVVASNGGRLLPDLTIREPLDGFDTLIIAGSPSVQDFEADLALIEWVRSESAHVRRLASICTGAFLLGSAGLLNGRRATT
ncbi:DJ-1/PfpI family protein, partial [Rhizobium ruizarguesonis]